MSIRLKELFFNESRIPLWPRFMKIVDDIQIIHALIWPIILYCPLFPCRVVTASDLYALFCGLTKLAYGHTEPILVLSDAFVSIGSKALKLNSTYHSCFSYTKPISWFTFLFSLTSLSLTYPLSFEYLTTGFPPPPSPGSMGNTLSLSILWNDAKNCCFQVANFF